MHLPPRALGTTLHWASLLPSGYCVPTREDIHHFVGFGIQDEVVNLPALKGRHMRDRIRQAILDHGLSVREHWPRFKGQPSVLGPVVFCPHSALKVKDWPMSHWMQLTESLHERGFTVEFETRGTLWELEAQLRRARWVVGVDTGSLHLADYMGIPTLGLYGYTTPETHGLQGPYSCNIYSPRGMKYLEVKDVLKHALTLDQSLLVRT